MLTDIRFLLAPVAHARMLPKRNDNDRVRLVGMDKDKQAALEIALGRIEKDYGKGAIMRLGEISDRLASDAIPTGSLALDVALGIGGIPRGRVTEIFGAESAGKSTLAIHIMAETQKKGGIAAYIDVEHALDPAYAANCGLNIDDLLIA